MGIGPLCTPLAAKFSQAKDAICPLVPLSVSKPGSLEMGRGSEGGVVEVMVMVGKGQVQIRDCLTSFPLLPPLSPLHLVSATLLNVQGSWVEWGTKMAPVECQHPPPLSIASNSCPGTCYSKNHGITWKQNRPFGLGSRPGQGDMIPTGSQHLWIFPLEKSRTWF